MGNCLWYPIRCRKCGLWHYCLWTFPSPQECAARLRKSTYQLLWAWLLQLSRTGQNHPTITNAEQGLSILSRFAADFEHPSPQEGYQRILYIKPEDTKLNYTEPDIAAILQRVRDSPAVNSSVIPRAARRLNRRRGGNRGYRGQRRGSMYAQGWRGLNLASLYVWSVLDKRKRVWMCWVKSSRRISNHMASSEIGGGKSRQDPFVVDWRKQHPFISKASVLLVAPCRDTSAHNTATGGPSLLIYRTWVLSSVCPEFWLRPAE